MKNIILFLVLIVLTSVAYFSNIDESLLFEDQSAIEKIQTNNYSLIYKDVWLFEEKKVKEVFISTFLKVLTSLELQSKVQYSGKTFGIMNVTYNDKIIKIELGEKLFANNGLYLKLNNNWFVVKNTFSSDIVYKDNNDLALKQYDILYNLFNFSKEIILKNTTNKP